MSLFRFHLTPSLWPLDFSLALEGKIQGLTCSLQWLISRAELARVDPRYAYPQPAQYTTYRPEYYNMQPNMPPPPPMYDPAGRPPMYEPPPQGTKAAPNQGAGSNNMMPTYRPPQVDEEYGAPSGPPPSHLAPEHTGNTNPYRQ